MTDFAFAPPPTVTARIAGGGALFPVRRGDRIRCGIAGLGEIATAVA